MCVCVYVRECGWMDGRMSLKKILWRLDCIEEEGKKKAKNFDVVLFRLIETDKLIILNARLKTRRCESRLVSSWTSLI